MPASIKVENNGAVVYVGSSLTIAQSFVFCSQIVTKEINAMFLVASKFKIERCARSGLEKLTKTYNKRV